MNVQEVEDSLAERVGGQGEASDNSREVDLTEDEERNEETEAVAAKSETSQRQSMGQI